ncbi:MAG TPA: DUF5682 family protein [Pedococcus sp.]|nr:DUF5682 family protein [Pedococcus sp.]
MTTTAALTSRDVGTIASRLVTDELVVLPVRHHSPACALQVQRVFRERRPSAVLVEGPRSMTPLVPLLTHDEARMPLAVYTYAVRPPGADGAPATRWAGYYPFCDYSPELVALREARAHGVTARFIDLDLAEQSLLTEVGTAATESGSLLDEGHYEHSARLQALAEQQGCRDHEDLWEHLFEADAGTTSTAEHVARVAAYCLLARRDHTPGELDADGTTAREAEMAWHVRQALRDRRAGDGPVLVVVGGFHAVALPALLDDPPERPHVPTAGVTGDTALIRYTFERLDRLSGYASGMTSPAWHQHLWTLLTDGAEQPRATATLTALLDVTAELRHRHRMPVPTPAVAAAYEQALRLAALRERVAPLRSDLLDAVTSCYVKGDADVDGVIVRAAAHHVLTGTAVGTVPPGAGTPPLVADATARLARARLNLDGLERRTAALDLYRRPEHRDTSRLLHGLALLAVPFAHRTAGPDFVGGHGLGRLQERWDYTWTPAMEGALVEASVLGSTVPEAVATRFGERLEALVAEGARGGAGQATALLVQACVLGLHQRAAEVLDLVRAAVANDPAFDSVSRAVVSLGLLWESREPLEARRLGGALQDVLRATYDRAAFLGRELGAGGCEPVAAAEALAALRELLVSAAGEALDPDLYWDLVGGLADGHDSALVRGAAAGLLYSSGRLDPPGLTRAVAGHLAGSVGAAESVGFLRGLLRTAREAAWQETELVTGIDRQLQGWDEQTFVAHLPDLRLAFAGMTPAETDRVAQLVARLHGLEGLGALLHGEVDEETVRAHVALSATVADLLAQDGLGSWAGRP